jgi:hypothetical protein
MYACLKPVSEIPQKLQTVEHFINLVQFRKEPINIMNRIINNETMVVTIFILRIITE